MSESELRRLAADLESDAALAQAAESERARGGDLVTFARARGYEVTQDDLARAGGEGELSDAELDGVAGGWTWRRLKDIHEYS